MNFINKKWVKKNKNEVGFSLLELITAMGLATVLLGMAVMNVSKLTNPSLTSAQEISAFIKQARAKAISTTSAYVVEPSSTGELRAKYANSCSAASFTYDNKLSLKLPAGASLSSIAWTLCFSSKGFPDQNLVISVTDISSTTSTIEVYLGGAVEIS